jgi:hypothetical protein
MNSRIETGPDVWFNALPGPSMQRPSLLCCVLLLAGCGGAAGPTDPPAITADPVGQAVIAGQAVTFAVVATGSPPLHYQWTRNQEPVPGDSPSLQLVATDADNNARYAVSVTNALGETASLDARLIVVPASPRPPAFGDLRFQQIASPSAIAGYQGGVFTNVGAGLSLQFTGVTGMPLMRGDACASAGCDWFVEAMPLPAEDTSVRGVEYRTSNRFDDLASDLDALATPDTVITSLDLHPELDTYAISALHAARPAFDRILLIAAAADVAQTVAAEGAKSRVVTALSANGGSVEILSYGWQGDTTTRYDTSVVSTETSGIAPAAAALAAQGYFITAIGSNGSGQSLVVGTKVGGDTAPRPFLQSPMSFGVQGDQPLYDGGYALVGLVFDGAAKNFTWLGER